MNWDAVGAIAELLSALAVVATLFYLVYQLRQNTEALRSNAYQSLHDAETELFRDMSRDQQLRELYAKAGEGLQALDEKERDQWSWLSRQYIFLIQNAHFQWSKGAMDDDMWRVWGDAFVRILKSHRGMRQMTRGFSPGLRADFVEFINRDIPIDVKRADAPSSLAIS